MAQDIFATLSEQEKSSLALLEVPHAKNRLVIITKAQLSDELLGKSIGEFAYTTSMSNKLFFDILKVYALLVVVIFVLFL